MSADRTSNGKTVENTGRSERIRTSDPVVPNDVRYQAALHSVTSDAGYIPPSFYACKSFHKHFFNYTRANINLVPEMVEPAL